MDSSSSEEDFYSHVEPTRPGDSLWQELLEETSTNNVLDNESMNSSSNVSEASDIEEDVDERQIVEERTRKWFRHEIPGRGVTEDTQNKNPEEITQNRNPAEAVYEELDYNEEDKIREKRRSRGRRKRNICEQVDDSFVPEELPDLIIRPYTPEKPFEIDMKKIISEMKSTLRRVESLDKLFQSI